VRNVQGLPKRANWPSYQEEDDMNAEQLFVALSHRLNDYAETVVLMLFLHWGLDSKPLSCSLEQISRNDLGGALSRKEVRRSVEHLKELGLISCSVYPNTKTEFHVNGEAVHALLREPIPDRPYFPGVSLEPMPFLQRIAADVAAARGERPAGEQS
jgi:hypothetical protein